MGEATPGYRRRVRNILRALGPWLDPNSRRSLVTLFVLAMGTLLAPLAWEIAEAAIAGITRPGQRFLSRAASVVAVGLIVRRILMVRPADAWPSEGDERRSPADRWLPWALRLAVASLLIPMVRDPDNLGFADWDFVLDKFEAVRRTILVWHQFPWWHPWCRGGFPLAAEPQIGAISMATPLILAFGTGVGLRVAAVLSIGIAVEGAYRLARLWLVEPWGAAVSALIFGLNGAVSVDTADGYIIAMSYGSVPWLAYHAFRIGDGLGQGVALGFWMAFAVLNGVQYPTLYAAILTAAIWLRAARVARAVARPTLAAAAIFLALAGWRVATMVPLLLEDRRERVTLWDESLVSAIRYLIDRPSPDWPHVIPGEVWGSYCSLTTYIGIVAVGLVCGSVRLGWRWWHSLAAIAGWLAIGSQYWYHPSVWLSYWPVIGSAHVVTRWRFVTILGFGLAAGSVVARWRSSGRGLLRGAAAAATLLIAADYVALAHQQLPLAFSVRPKPGDEPGPPVPGIVNVRRGLGYPCVRRGYGVIEGYEPMLSYLRDAPTLRRAREDPDYRGEAWTADGEVRPIAWSPNRIVFRVRPDEVVFLNQNPGSWWLVNGRRIFAGLRCAERMVPFAVRADGNGRLELTIDPPGLQTGILLHIAGVVLLAAAWAGHRPRRGLTVRDSAGSLSSLR